LQAAAGNFGTITGSLATILWLLALRREGESIGAGSFLRIGAVVMPPALILALGALGQPAGSSDAQRRHREAAKGCRGDPDIAAVPPAWIASLRSQ
jgi:hypothetical protein